MRVEGRVGVVLLAAWVIAVLQCFGLLLAGVWVATRPPIFDRYYGILVRSPSSRDAHEIVAWLKSDRTEQDLLVHVVDRRLTEKELKHFADVRSWLHKVPKYCLGCALLITLAFFSARRANFVPLIERRSLVFMVLVLCGCIALASWDWRIFFTWVHYPLFGSTSWRFPRGSYSLQLFPSSFWRAAGIMVAAPALLIPILLLGLRCAAGKKPIKEESPK